MQVEKGAPKVVSVSFCACYVLFKCVFCLFSEIYSTNFFI